MNSRSDANAATSTSAAVSEPDAAAQLISLTHPLAVRVHRHHQLFVGMLARVRQLVSEGNYDAALQAAGECAHSAWMQHSGLFASPELEALLADVGHTLPSAERKAPADGMRRVLTIMTSVHAVGGHSRIAWRWIGLDTGSVHTLVLTQQEGRALPEQLVALQQTGQVCIVQLDEPSWLGRAASLRDLVAGADQVVLLTHPDDVLACTAVPAVHPAPPVLTMDHASHVFWLGVGITTLAINTATMVLEHRRGIPRENIGWALLPMDFPRLERPSVLDVRAAYGIPVDAPLLLSAGSPFKYWPIEGCGLATLVAPALDQNPAAHLLVVGVTEAPHWIPLQQRFAGRVHLSGYLPEPDLVACYHACDVYIDSAPLSSPTTVLEAAALGKPIVRYAPVDWRGTGFSLEFDCIPADFYLWTTPQAYATDISRLLNDPQFRHWRGDFCRKAVRLYYAEDTFRHSIELLYAKANTLAHIVPNTRSAVARCERIDTLLVQLADNMAAQRALEATRLLPRPAPRLLAFYLPQFHAIPENDAWWGPGFTEWTNVRSAQPLFEGHAQPLVPAELGYYDLSSVDVLATQARLAREHGIHGFCFHYYWFDGKRLLEKPVDQLLAHREIDLPFCLCWANENWTRRWDGGEHDVLMQQSYAPALHQRFASDLAPYFCDPRYIRVDGRPVLLVYRTDVIPDLSATTAAWRAAWREMGVGEVYLVAVESFVPIAPEKHGFDAAAEFPPHQVHAATLPPDEPPNLLADPDARVGDYRKLARTWLARPRPPYKRFHGLLPGWDNSARRRRGGATLFVDASPDAYEHWLAQAVGRTLDEFQGEERLVFVNAWNEWGEGCTLEPDERWGRGYLEATRRVMRRPAPELRAIASTATPVSDYERWLEQASAKPADALLPALRAAGSSVALSVAISGSDAAHLAATHAALATQLRPADLIVAGTYGPLADLQPALEGNGWTLCLCAGDTLAPDGLAQLARALAAAPAKALVAYLDHDERDEDGGLHGPALKPAFNHELLLSCPYMARALVVRTDWLRPHLTGAEVRFDLPFAYGLMLAALRYAGAAAFLHVPSLALHLHDSEPAVFAKTSHTWQALAKQLAHHVALTEPGSHLLEGPLPGSFHLVPPLARTPLVSIIIPTRDQLPLISRCIESMLAKTAYPSFELLIVDNDSQTPEARDFLDGLSKVMPERIRVLREPGAFNFSRMNNFAAREARGEFLLLLNNDTAALQDDWLTHLVRQGLRPGVGAVGARLLFPDGSLQHAGVVLGLCGPADHPLLGLPGNQPGYLGRAQLTQNFSAVTAACLLVSKAVYDELGGLDETQFGVSYNDVDFCLRIGATGRRIVWTPLATLLHEGSASQRSMVEGKTQQQKEDRYSAEQTAFYARWPKLVAQDPHYSPHLSLSDRHYEIETRTVLRPDPLRGLAPHHVAAFAADANGCGQYRVLQPLAAMLEAGLCTGSTSPEFLPTHLLLRSGADTLVFQRPYTDQGLAALRAAQAVPNVRTVYELDDNMAQVPMKSLHRDEMPKDLRGRVLKGIGMCDRLVVSTEPLAQALGAHAADVRVVPNRLPPRMWGDTPPSRCQRDDVTRRPRIGWAGGVGHFGDLAMIAEVVRELASEVDWVCFGMCPPTLRPYMSAYYAGVPTLDYPRRLMRMTQDWDLAIAPLEVNAFNECKSNLKLLEYGWCGVPVICSDITPYQCSLPATRVRNRHRDWITSIREHLDDLPATKLKGDALQQAVAAEWVLRGEALHHWHRSWLE